MEAPWRTAVAQVFVDSLEEPGLRPAELHHLRKVLRLRPGESVCAADGRGGYRMCRMPAASSEVLVQDGDVVRTPAPVPTLRVGFAPVKGDRVEGVVQKLTELGVDRIEVLHTERSVVRWAQDRAARQRGRLGEVVRAAAAQCRRLWLPELRIADHGGPLPAGALADAGGRPMRTTDVDVLIGPEGGWTDTERAGRELIGLGPHVLRADTAAVVAAALMTGLRAGVVAPAGGGPSRC